MSIETALDRFHSWVVQRKWLRRLTLFTRVVLAIGFIPPGLKKVVGQPFADPNILTPDTPIGYFFDAFFQAEGYYVFVGLAQVIAGLLLLIPRTALLGAVLYFPIILNIFVITVSLHFRGTWVIAGLMLLASMYLLFWDYDRLKSLLPFQTRTPVRNVASTPAGEFAESIAYLAAIGGGLGFMSHLIGVAPFWMLPVALVALVAATLLGLYTRTVRRRTAQARP